MHVFYATFFLPTRKAHSKELGKGFPKPPRRSPDPGCAAGDHFHPQLGANIKGKRFPPVAARRQVVGDRFV
jgi:hypothetical protein